MSNYDIKPTVLAFDEKTGMYTQVERVITNQDQADQFYLELSDKISPENIHEDGEITLHEADAKYLAILKTILKLNKRFTPPEELRECSDDPDAFFDTKNVIANNFTNGRVINYE